MIFYLIEKVKLDGYSVISLSVDSGNIAALIQYERE